ncbi:MAG: extracellular solute-binding protein [Eubacteriales bacterium]|nr:extracellular solute-binding protein [Eubacteriales bacterium]
MQKRTRKMFAGTMALMMLFGTGTAAGVSAEETHEPVTLTIVHEHSEEAAANIPSSAAFRYCMDKYKEDHPWVTLEETIIANSDIQNKYTALIAADELPDLTYVKYTLLESTAGTGMLADLTDYVDPDNYYDGLASTTYEGKIYGMPNKFSIYNLLCYNTALWEEAGYNEIPETFEELLAAADAFDALGIDTISLGNTAKWFAVSYFTDALAYNYCGEEWVDKIIAGDSSVKWTDECFQKVMETQAEMAKLFNADFNMTDDITAATMYMQGKAASHVVGGWGISTLQGLSADYPEVWENTRVVLVPSAGGSEDYLINACGAAMGVSSRLEAEGNEEKLQAAIEFCQYISSADYAQYCAEHGTTTPVKTEYDWTDLGQPFVDMADVINNTPHTGLNFNDYINDTVKMAIQNETQAVLAGATTPEAACANIQAVQEQVFE